MPGALVLAAALLAALVCVAFAGPAALGAVRPQLSLRPRTAIAAVAVGGAAWVLALISVGPVLTWSVTGPGLVPGAAGEVCRQCLAATNPFSEQPVPVGIPSAVLIGASALTIAVIAASLLRELVVLIPRACRSARADLRATSCVAGVRVRVDEDRTAFAYALPARCGGIVVSRGAVDLLDEEELRAVVAHEAIHVEHRHHLIAALARGTAAPLRWIPFIATCERTVLDLLEIDADAGALRTVGTGALVSALVKLQEAERPRAPEAAGASAVETASVAGPEVPAAGALSVLGATGGSPREGSPVRGGRREDGPSARVASLVGRRQRPRRWPGAGLAVLIAPVSAAGVGVHAAGAVALLSGCAVL
ncbi:M56 family metallopeptidase [Brevibacterium jeotgali]|uniref:Zn-dependent protease with chaperone function n=1 Tax=Brevibacterium jeotgali TaxID=1262550 RepID=A0A2H1L4F1_9MICO|nr:M56 family metallopeptidase [Brevibacterium jeotgali]TWB98760.1 Zn-dependent protease with chaperone function [Brevibacterium jeotgali]SMY11640.1 Zn-dependent protease with chaperone function [Brevibacterium jeotgali]